MPCIFTGTNFICRVNHTLDSGSPLKHTHRLLNDRHSRAQPPGRQRGGRNSSPTQPSVRTCDHCPYVHTEVDPNANDDLDQILRQNRDLRKQLTTAESSLEDTLLYLAEKERLLDETMEELRDASMRERNLTSQAVRMILVLNSLNTYFHSNNIQLLSTTTNVKFSNYTTFALLRSICIKTFAVRTSLY